MEDELRLSLLIAGTCFIVAVLAHGIWKIRKNSKLEGKPRQEPRQWSDEHDDQDPVQDYASREEPEFDELGIGQVRVVSPSSKDENQTEPYTDERELSSPLQDTLESEDDAASTLSHDESTSDEVSKSASSPTQKQTEPSTPEPEKPKLYGSVVSNPKPHMQSGSRVQGEPTSDNAQAFPEPPGFLLKDEEDNEQARQPAAEEPTSPSVDTFSLDAQQQPEPLSHSDTDAPPARESIKSPSFGDQAKKLVKPKRQKSTMKRRQEPSIGDDQIRIDFDKEATAQQAQDTAKNQSNQSASSGQEQEVLVLNVRAQDDDHISGAALLPMLLTLGFKFGDQDIFHRHVNANGKGPVLFSLANMFKPGIFDIDNLETFSTQGVSLFMILPIEGDPHQVFNMMHNAARKLADEFNAQVLDGRRSVLTKQGLQQYVEKIREFERKRIISSH